MTLRPVAAVAGARGPAFGERVGVVVEVRQAGVLACRGALTPFRRRLVYFE
jgi:hypothetical protein